MFRSILITSIHIVVITLVALLLVEMTGIALADAAIISLVIAIVHYLSEIWIIVEKIEKRTNKK